MGRLMSWGVTQPPHCTFYPIPGSNLGSRKQKLQPSNSGLGNKHTNLTVSECQKKKSVWRVVKYGNKLSFINLVLYTAMVIRTKAKEILLVALHLTL